MATVRVLGTMAAVLLVIAAGLAIYAGQVDRQGNIDELASVMAGRNEEGADGGVWRIGAAVAAGLGVTLGAGATAAWMSDGQRR